MLSILDLSRLDQFSRISIDFHQLSQCQFANSNDNLEYFKKDCGIDFYVKKIRLSADEVPTYLCFFPLSSSSSFMDTNSFFLYTLGNFWYPLVHFDTLSAFLLLFGNFWRKGPQIGSDMPSAL